MHLRKEVISKKETNLEDGTVESDIWMSEVEQSINRLRNGKSLGIDYIPAELVK